MKKIYFLKTIILTTILLIGNVNAWAQAKVFFEFKGTNGYLAPPATGWISSGAEGGTYLKLSPGSITSPEYTKATELVFKYDIASFGSGSASQTKLSVLASNGSLIKEYTLAATTSSTYATNQTLNIGEITTNFKIKIEGLGTGANNNSVRGTRLRNYSLEGKEVTEVPSPTINVTPSSLVFGNIDINAVSQGQTVSVIASNLTTSLSYAITGANTGEFNVTGTLNDVGGLLNISFAPISAGSKEAVLTITDGTISKTVNLSGTGITLPLVTPIVSSNPIKHQDGFTAEWDIVPGATEYILNVYTKNVTRNTGSQVVLSENFDSFAAGATGSGAHTTDISTSLDNYTKTSGWAGTKVYQAGGSAKLGSSSALGYITTPQIDLSANDGKFDLSFESMAWNADAASINIYLNDVLVYTVTDLNNDENYTLKSYNIPLSNGTSTSQIKFEGLQASKSRFFLENLEISQGNAGAAINHIEGSPFNGIYSTSYTVAGLTSNIYYYTIIAKNEYSTSSPSNEVTVDLSSTTGVDQTKDVSSINVWVSGGKVYFKAIAGESIEVFSITGQKLDSRVAVEGINNLNISAKGVIILKIGNKATKVIL